MIKRVSKSYSKDLQQQIERNGASTALNHAMAFVGKLELAVLGEDQGEGGEYHSFIGGENSYYDAVKRLSRDCKRITIYFSLKQLNSCVAVRVEIDWHASENDKKIIPGHIWLDFIEGGVTAYGWKFDKKYRVEE